MLRVTPGMLQRSILSDLNTVADQLSRSQHKAASGREITRPSDDPYGTTKALQLSGALEGTRQYQRNAQDGRAWQDITEQALNNITQAAQRARDLVVQG